MTCASVNGVRATDLRCSNDARSPPGEYLCNEICSEHGSSGDDDSSSNSGGGGGGGSSIQHEASEAGIVSGLQ